MQRIVPAFFLGMKKIFLAAPAPVCRRKRVLILNYGAARSGAKSVL
jgi:hypothetical protein